MTTLVVKHKQCKHKLDILTLGVITAQVRCVLEPGHRGPHRCPAGMWVTQDRIQSIIENEGVNK